MEPRRDIHTARADARRKADLWLQQMRAPEVQWVEATPGFEVTLVHLAAEEVAEPYAVVLHNRTSQQSFVVRSFEDEVPAVRYACDFGKALHTWANPCDVTLTEGLG